MQPTREHVAPRQTLAAAGREAQTLLLDPDTRGAWLSSAKRARRWLLVAVVAGLFVVPWLTGLLADTAFEPKRSRRLFGRDRVTRDSSAEVLDGLLQLAFWVGSLGYVAVVAWRERPSGRHLPLQSGVTVAGGDPPGSGVATRQPSAGAQATATAGAPMAPTLAASNDQGAWPGGARYRIESELGRGGMGVVYVATDTVLDRTVALKSLPAELLANQELVRRFQREAKLLAALSHPHIVGVHDLVSQDGQLYMAMELVKGRDLSALLEERGSLPEAEAVELALQCARALAHAHAAGIIHRDFKPDNVLLTADGIAKVTDFGIAKSQDGPKMTQTGALMGTPYYMSPEQSSGAEVDARTDLYALGATLYELLCGEPPFVGNTAQILIQHISQPPPPLRERAPGVSEDLASLVHALLEKDREQRPADMGEVVTRLEQLAARRAASA